MKKSTKKSTAKSTKSAKSTAKASTAKAAKVAKVAKVVDPRKPTYKNPYRSGSKYAAGFDVLRANKKTSFTLAEFTAACEGTGLGKAGIGVLTSPTPHSERGDCRGNFSAKGEFYFVERLAKKKGEDQKLRFGWRKEVLDAHNRKSTAQVDTSESVDVEGEASEVASNEVSA